MTLKRTVAPKRTLTIENGPASSGRSFFDNDLGEFMFRGTLSLKCWQESGCIDTSPSSNECYLYTYRYLSISIYIWCYFLHSCCLILLISPPVVFSGSFCFSLSLVRWRFVYLGRQMQSLLLTYLFLSLFQWGWLWDSACVALVYGLPFNQNWVL